MTKGRPIILFTAATLFAIAIYLLVVSPLYDWRNATIANRDAATAEMDRLAVSIARLRAEKEAFRDETLNGLTWDGAQLAEVTARVQSSINDMAREDEILMRSIAPTNMPQTTFPDALGFRLEFEATIDTLVPFLWSVENQEPAIVVTRANFRKLTRPTLESLQPEVFVQIDVLAPITLTVATSP